MQQRTCADPERLARGAQSLTNQCFFLLFSFLVDEGRKDPNTAISGPSSARQRNTISMAFHWRADVGPTLNADLVAL